MTARKRIAAEIDGPSGSSSPSPSKRTAIDPAQDSASPLSTLDTELLQRHIPPLKARLLERLAGAWPRLPPTPRETLRGEECVGLQDAWLSLHSTVDGSLKGQANSALVVGRSGTGKSLLLESVLRSLGWRPDQPRDGVAAAAAQRPFHLVHLDARVQHNDNLAMREMARQLIRSGAIEMDSLSSSGLDLGAEGVEQGGGDEPGEAESDAGSASSDDEDEDEEGEEQQEEEDSEEEREARAVRREKRLAEREEQRRKRQAEQAALQAAILSSMATTITTLLALLSAASANASQAGPKPPAPRTPKPLVVLLSFFDLFTHRHPQALLYVLLDAVQAGSYAPGLCVLGTTSRLDTMDLLEKRVKSRFSGRVLHLFGPQPERGGLEEVLRRLLLRAGDEEARDVEEARREAWSDAWHAEVETFLHDELVRHQISAMQDLGGDVRSLYRSFFERVARLGAERAQIPARPTPSELEDSSASQVAQRVLLDLPLPHLALLVAAKHLVVTKNRETFSFEQLLAGVRVYVRRSQRELGGGGGGGSSSSNSRGARLEDRGIGTTTAAAAAMRIQTKEEWATRARMLLAFRTLLELGLFLPASATASRVGMGVGISGSASTSAPASAASSNLPAASLVAALSASSSAADARAGRGDEPPSAHGGGGGAAADAVDGQGAAPDAAAMAMRVAAAGAASRRSRRSGRGGGGGGVGTAAAKSEAWLKVRCALEPGTIVKVVQMRCAAAAAASSSSSSSKRPDAASTTSKPGQEGGARSAAMAAAAAAAARQGTANRGPRPLVGVDALRSWASGNGL